MRHLLSIDDLSREEIDGIDQVTISEPSPVEVPA